LAALDRLQADIVAGRSLDVAPFNTIASLQTLHRAAAAELGLDAEATTAQMAQALDEHRSQEAARASLARARRLEGPAGAAAAISRAQALAQELTERSDWADEDRALAGALTALLDLTECDPADLERLLACEAAARAGLPGDLLGLCALAGRGVHLSNGASQVPAASPVPADEPVTGALLTEPVVAPEEAQARAPVEKAPPAVFVPVDEPPAPQAPVEEAPPAASALAPGEPVPRGGVSWLPALVLVTAIGLLVVGLVVWRVETSGSSSSTPGPSTVALPAAGVGAPPAARPRRIAAAAVPLTLTGAGTGGSYVLVQRGSATGAVVYEGIIAPAASVHLRVSGSLLMRVGRPPHLRVLLGGRSIRLSGGTGDFTVTRTGITSPS
jgi:hypothetical protein